MTIGVPLPAAAPAATRVGGAVLVCDDNVVSSTLLAEMQRSDGHNVAVVDNVDAAFARWRLGYMRAVISDLNTPAAGGEELVQRIRREEATSASRTVLIICSGDPAPPMTEQAPQFDAFISKPVDMRTLTDTLRALGVALRAFSRER